MPDTKPGMNLEVRDLGRMPYAQALAIQRQINLDVSLGNHPGADACLLLVEHDPVITITHRKGAWDNLLAREDTLKQLGIKVEVTDRGGDITYHGPGQLVAYPILKLNPLALNLSSYMRLLEQIVIDTVADFGIHGQRDPDATGVWVETSGLGSRVSGLGKPGSADTRIPIPDTRLAKLCAMGVRVRKNTTMHGLALNVSTNLEHFKTIDPCGLGGRPVTSLHELLGDNAPTMEEVKNKLVDHIKNEVQNRTITR